jgi:protein-disulfide isomerase
LSEQLSPESAPPPQEPLEVQSVESGVEPAPPSRTKWIAPAWFLFGILVGVIGFAAYNALIVKSAPTTAAAPALDAVAIRSAARDGTLDAIATLQAGGAAAQQQQPQSPQDASADAFTVRAANRQGNPDAKVTIYEFSDFQ